MKSPSELLDEKINSTLSRVSELVDYSSASDLYNIIRWAKQGKLKLKVNDDATDV